MNKKEIIKAISKYMDALEQGNYICDPHPADNYYEPGFITLQNLFGVIDGHTSTENFEKYLKDVSGSNNPCCITTNCSRANRVHAKCQCTKCSDGDNTSIREILERAPGSYVRDHLAHKALYTNVLPKCNFDKCTFYEEAQNE